jgi:site-specific recombinase XerC
LVVNGKGGHVREVPVPKGLMRELEQYLQLRGLDPDPGKASNNGIPLIGHAGAGVHMSADDFCTSDASTALSASAMYKSLKCFFDSVATSLRRTSDEAGARKFDRASTHWMRHTHASHSIASGVPLEIAQQNLGHQSLTTTTVYVHTERSRRVQAMEGFWNGVAG